MIKKGIAVDFIRARNDEQKNINWNKPPVIFGLKITGGGEKR